MADMPETITLKVGIEDLSELTASRLLSMAEAALDVSKPHWRHHVPQIRQSLKDEMAMALFEAATTNPVGRRCGVAMSEAGHNERPRPPHNGGD